MATKQYSNLRLPYFAPKEVLPGPLPTIPEILAAENVFPCIFNKRFIRRVGRHFTVKHGEVELDEADNMYFVEQHSDGKILTPKLYAAFHDMDTDSNFIIMEYVPGKSLETVWTDLGEEGRTRVAAQLKGQFAALRSISPEGYYGKLGRRAYDDIFLGSDRLACGPFASEPELNAALYGRYAALHPELAGGRGAFYRDRVFPAAMVGHPPVFTHGDLQAKNILVRDADGAPVVLDWECSAWYPSYWEYANALWTSRRWGDDWWAFLSQVLEEHVVEFKCMENLLGDLLDAPQPGV